MGCVTSSAYKRIECVDNIEHTLWYKFLSRCIEQQCFALSAFDQSMKAQVACEIQRRDPSTKLLIANWTRDIDNMGVLYMQLTNAARQYGNEKKFQQFEQLVVFIEKVISEFRQNTPEHIQTLKAVS